MKKRPLTDLQQRVLGAVGEDWTIFQHVRDGCRWGMKGCRRSQASLLLVLEALLKHGLIESSITEGLTVYRRTHARSTHTGGGA